MLIDLGQPMTQASFGDLVGITQPAVSDLLRRQVLRDRAAAGEWLLAYCDHLREIAAGRGGEESQSLAAERARLAKEQADKIAMQNAVTRRELVPVSVVENVLASIGAKIGRLLDSIPGTLRRRVATLSTDDVNEVRLVLAKCRNMAAGFRLASLADDDGDAEAVPSESDVGLGDA